MEMNATAAQSRPFPVRDGMVFVPGGRFLMGSDRHYVEEAPAHPVRVDVFLIDRHPVTNRDFARLIAATGHATVAEIAPRAEDYPGAVPELLRAGSLVFEPRSVTPGLGNALEWWSWVFGADWRHPRGPESSSAGLDDHPVVHVAHADAAAYAAWAGKALPTEAEWEFAARGGLEAAEYAWGDDFAPGGRQMANTWQGRFPVENLLEDGYARTSPVGAFPPNGYGLFDMIGNVWEWTDDFWADQHAPAAARRPPPAAGRGTRAAAPRPRASTRAPRRSASRARY